MLIKAKNRLNSSSVEITKPIVLNFYAEPGAGKSTSAANVFAYLKNEGCNVELITEYAKECVYQNATHKLRNQIYITAKQYKRMKDVADYGVKFLITDSPILFGKIYASGVSYFETYSLLLDALDNEFYNVNVLVERVKKYNPDGRYQTEEEAALLLPRIKELANFDYIIQGEHSSQIKLANILLQQFGNIIRY